MDGRTGIEKNSKEKQIFLRAAKDKKLWRAVSAHVLKGHGIYTERKILFSNLFLLNHNSTTDVSVAQTTKKERKKKSKEKFNKNSKYFRYLQRFAKK